MLAPSFPKPAICQEREAAATNASRSWPRWRGPLESGFAPHADPPIEWSETPRAEWEEAARAAGLRTARTLSFPSVVLHGDGVYLLRDAVKDLKLQGEVTNLKSQKVAFNICANTLKGRKLDPDTDLFEVFKEDIVPSGVAELSYLQGQGFTYVKP